MVQFVNAFIPYQVTLGGVQGVRGYSLNRHPGAHRVICPFKSGGGEIANVITKPGVAEFLNRASLGDANVTLAELTIDHTSRLLGRTLGDYGRTEGTRICFVALERGGDVMIPAGGREEIRAGDHLIVAGDPQQIEEMMSEARAAAAA